MTSRNIKPTLPMLPKSAPQTLSTEKDHRGIPRLQSRAGSRSLAEQENSSENPKRSTIRSRSCDEFVQQNSFKSRMESVPLDSKSSENVYEDAYNLESPSNLITAASMDDVGPVHGDVGRKGSRTRPKSAKTMQDIPPSSNKSTKIELAPKSFSEPSSPRDLSPVKSHKDSSKMQNFKSQKSNAKVDERSTCEAPSSDLLARNNSKESTMNSSKSLPSPKSEISCAKTILPPLTPRASSPIKETLRPIGGKIPRSRLLSRSTISKIPSPVSNISGSLSTESTTSGKMKRKPISRVSVVQSTAKRTLEVQYATKKKRFALLKKELFDKQEPESTQEEQPFLIEKTD